MRLFPERHLARLAIALGVVPAGDIRQALTEFRRRRLVTIQEFGALLLRRGAIDRDRLEQLHRMAIAVRMVCPACRGAVRVFQADLEARQPCPRPPCAGTLAVATDQRPADLDGLLPEPVLRPGGDGGRILEEGVPFERLEAEAEAEAERFLVLREVLRSVEGAGDGERRGSAVPFRPSNAWRRPRSSILLAGGVGGVALFGFVLVSSAVTDSLVPVALGLGGLLVVGGGTALLARGETAGISRRHDQLVLSGECGLVHVAGGVLRCLPWETIERLERGDRILRVVPSAGAGGVLALGPECGYVRLRAIEKAIWARLEERGGVERG